MQSTSPPPPPPYASKHTIIAAPPAVSNRSSFTSLLSPTSKSPSPDPSGHRVSTALNITFSPPPASNGNGGFTLEQPRRHVVQRVSTPPSPLVNTFSPAASIVNAAPTEWKPGICSKCGARITNVATACQALGCFYHDKCFNCSICHQPDMRMNHASFK